jgi:hypothetical protein
VVNDWCLAKGKDSLTGWGLEFEEGKGFFDGVGLIFCWGVLGFGVCIVRYSDWFWMSEFGELIGANLVP